MTTSTSLQSTMSTADYPFSLRKSLEHSSSKNLNLQLRTLQLGTIRMPTILFGCKILQGTTDTQKTPMLTRRILQDMSCTKLRRSQFVSLVPHLSHRHCPMHTSHERTLCIQNYPQRLQ